MKIRIFTFLLALLIPFLAYSQSDNTDFYTVEEPEDPYVFVDKSVMERQPPYRMRNGGFFTNQVNIDGSGNDIIGDAGNEPSIAIDPTNPDRIVIGWRQFNTITNNFREAGNAYSLDGGQTWINPGVIDPGQFRSDPVLDFDANGNLYYNSLRVTIANEFFCDVYKITDGGQNWGFPFVAHGGDKQWMRLDRSGGIGDGNNYSYWNSSFTSCPPGSFTRSTDGSNTFEDCLVIDGDPRWGTLAVDGNGDLYMSGVSNLSGQMVVVKSTNAKDPGASITWDAVTTVDLDGTLSTGPPLNPSGLWGQSWVDVDVSGGAGDGNVYMCASVPRISVSDPADVMFAKSTDGGATFSPPIRINKDNLGNHNWFGVLSVAPNGRIDVIWLDTRNAANNVDSELYYSYSDDQGDTWSDDAKLSLQFDPTIGYPNQAKMGDYFDMVSTNDGAHLAWANTLNGGQDVYYSFIPPGSTLGIDDVVFEEQTNLQVSPNPFSENVNISFTALADAKLSLEVYDILGRKVATVFNNEAMEGFQKIQWDGKQLNSGLYFVRLFTDNNEATAKIIKL